MGILRSKTYLSNIIVNGITLGDPVLLVRENENLRPQKMGDSVEDLWYCWDDSSILNGEVLSDGTVLPDE